MSNKLEIKGFSLAYGEKVLFKNFDYTFEPGIYVFSGESGIGKTTLMRFIAGLEKKWKGSVVLNGKALKGCTPDIHMVHQHYLSFPWLNLVDNVLMVYKGHKEPITDEDRKLAEEVLKTMGLGEQLKQYPTQISGGQDQRLSIASAFVNKWSKVMLYDEPSSALDEENTIKVGNMIKEHQQKYGTIEIVITHQDELRDALNGTIIGFEKSFRIRD